MRALRSPLCFDLLPTPPVQVGQTYADLCRESALILGFSISKFHPLPDGSRMFGTCQDSPMETFHEHKGVISGLFLEAAISGSVL